MVKEDEIVAFIPVRGGSKSIPNKNINIISGQPLVYWVIDAAVNCDYINKVYISTDSEEIKKCIKKYDKENSEKIICINRSSHTAEDHSTTESAMIEFAERYKFGNILLIQATSPLLSSEDLSKAISKYLESDMDSLLSVVKQKRFIWGLDDSEEYVQSESYILDKRPRRQDYEGFLVENGSFYITGRKLLLETKTRISGNIGYFLMDEDSYFEIDEPSDWLVLESLLNNKKKSYITENGFDNIKLFAMDCDGVLTDGGMYYTEEGKEMKKFNTRDGMGISLLHQNGIRTAIITGENTSIVKNRAKKLGISDVFLGVKDKVSVLEHLLEKYNLNYNQVAFVGDDINDLSLLKKVQFSFSVNDALSVVKEEAKYITSRNGGDGAVREIVDLIISKNNGGI